MPPTLARYIILCICMLGSCFVQGQSIGGPTVSGTPVCAGSTVEISFEVTNGGWGDRFSGSTRYYVYFGTGIESINNYNVIAEFTSGTAPNNSTGATAIITRTITIPEGTRNGTDYRIGIRSSNPNPNHSAIYVSNTFQVGEVASNADQNTEGINEWVGHIYNDRFGTYLGRYTKPAIFDENFGNSGCFNFSYNGQAGVVNTETFSVRYRMRSALKGMYSVSIGSDDGSRLNIDGTEVYNQWSDHSYAVNQNVLISLSGSSSLLLEYYENSGGNRVSLNSNLNPIILNTLTQNTTQTISAGNTGRVISGDTFEEYGNLPTGISKTGSGYQWYYSTSVGGAKIAISGATGATYTPSTTSTLFNTPGTYYLYRQARLTSTNNRLASAYNATNFSDAAVFNVQQDVSITQQPVDQSICQRDSTTFSVQATGTNLSYQWYAQNGYNWVVVNNSEKYSGATSSTLTIANVQTDFNNYLFRVVVSSEGSPKTSASATLKVTEGPGWVTQNQDKTICAGEIVSFEAYSSEAIFQWEVSTNGGSSWTDLTNDSTHSNVTTSRIEIRNASTSMNNNLYRVKVFKNGCSLSPSPSRLTVNPLPGITYHPSNITSSPGNNATFEIGASGTNLTYRWQADSGYGWGDIYDDANQNGTTTPRLTVNNIQSYQNGNEYRVRITNSSGCVITSNTATLNTLSGPCGDGEGALNTQDDQTITATDSWRGHVYDGTNFNTYIGYYNEPETFFQNFGGDANCFQIMADSNPVTIYTETFSVRYKMNSTQKGLYVVEMGSDDGSRLRVDGDLVYNSWAPQSYYDRPGVLLNLSGNSQLEYEFYEEGGGNRLNFSNLTRVLENRLSVNQEQNICPGSSPTTISGDTFASLPAGLNNPNYQWTYSTSGNGTRITIPGATSASFTPNLNSSPFNQSGTYYVFRNAAVTSSNNLGFESLVATNESNPAIVTINSQISGNEISYGTTGIACGTANEGGIVNISAPEGTVFTSVNFASYGLPTGNCENFSLGSCHAANSKSIVEGYLLGENSANIPATNAVFGDPCNGTVKRLYIQATYAEPIPPICSGSNPGNIKGSTPEGLDSTTNYLWEVSTTGPDNGFSEAPGENSLRDYNPGELSETTWFRRTVVSENCQDNSSNIVKLEVNPLPTIDLNAPEEICGSQTVPLTGNFKGIGPWTVMASLNGSGPVSYDIADRNFNFPIEISETTTIEILQITDNGTSCINDAPNTSVTITVFEQVVNNTIAGGQTLCGSSVAESLTGNDAGDTINYMWESSTTSPDEGFVPATGNNTGIHYAPGELEQTTWFRRKATSGVCAESISNAVKITVYDEISNNTISYSGETENVCSGNAALEIMGSQPAGGDGEYIYLWESSTSGPDERFGAAEESNSGINYTPGELSETTWFRRNVSSHANCVDNVSEVIKIIVNPLPTAVVEAPAVICTGQYATITGTFTGTGPWRVNVTMNGQNFTVPDISVRNFSQNLPVNQTTIFEVISITDLGTTCVNTDPGISFTVTVNNEWEWIGAVSNDWNNTGNWSCNSLPALQNDILIPAGLSNYPEINSGDAALSKDISIENGASVLVDNYSIHIAGKISNSGVFDATNGHIWLAGSSAQTIPSQAFVENRIKNLTLNNSSGVISQGALEITGILKAQSGNFNTSNNLTLISNEVRTALIDGSGTGEVIGTVKMQRYMDNSFGYKYFSSPFQNSTVGDFAPYINLNESFPNFYSYNENRKDVNANDATGWEVYTNPTAALNAVEGYALNFGDSVVEKTVEISGTVNNGNYSRMLYNNNGEYTQGFNLVGNPYPSPIDWNAATGWTKTNVDDAIYFFRAGTTDRYTGTYTSYVNGVQSDDGKSSNVIPSMQGFFVHVSDNTVYPVSGTLGMSNAVRVNNFSQPFLKQSAKQTPALIRITAGFEGEQSVDPAVIYFHSFATTGFEKDLDAHKLMNTAVNVPNLYSFTPERDKLAISAISNGIGREPERIPLGIKADKAGAMAISLKDTENLSTGAYIYLVDEEKRNVQDLNSDPVYRFQAQKGEINSRFYLVFSNTRISDPAVFYNEPFSVETQNGQVLVRMNLKKGESGPLQISTVTGQIINVLEVAEKEVVEVKRIRSTGVYFISYLSGKETFTKKVLVKK